jgi:ABC-type lipoprotein export system ATPase subunit
MIKLDGVSRIYETGAGAVRALDGVSTVIEPAEFVAIMGQSGSGKSTMMNIIGCLDRPTSGTYTLRGHDVGRLSEDARARLRGGAFGFVFQSYNLLPRLSALEQVELPLVYQRTPNRRRKAAEALVRVGLKDRLNHVPTQLSGGEQQRVAIARSLVVDPLVLLADEPTGALDTRTGAELMQLLTDLVEQQGITVVIVTHERDVAAYAHRTLRMRDGRIVEDTARPRLREVALPPHDEPEPDQSAPDQSAPDQSAPDQSAPDQSESERESTEVSG